jgi:hypothetical protein
MIQAAAERCRRLSRRWSMSAYLVG